MLRMALVFGLAPVLVCGCLAVQAQTAPSTTTNPATVATAANTKATAPAAATPIPPNTIDCKDWQRNPDGTWKASATAKPFDLGPHKRINYHGRTIAHCSAMFDDTDLWEVLEAKCSAQAKSKPQTVTGSCLQE